jgi:tetratricopeptide (TPR) repeat protein
MPLYTSLGRAYHLTGQHDEEQEIYELGLGINPDHPRIFYRQAVCAFSLDDTVKAHAFLESFRRITNDQGWIQSVINYHIGGIYADARKYPQAIEVYQQVIEAVPGYSRAKAQLASVLIGQDIDVDGGMRLIESALADRPDNYSFMVIKGEGLIRLGHHEEALQVLKEAWELRPFYDHAHYLLIQEVQNALAGRSP